MSLQLKENRAMQRVWLAVILGMCSIASGHAQDSRDCSNCPEMVSISPGAFKMGTPPGEDEREGIFDDDRGNASPQVEVSIEYRFSLGKYEVTRGEFAAFVEETRRDMGHSCWVFFPERRKYANTPGRGWLTPGYTQDDSHPVVCVTYDDAVAYTAWLSRKTGKRYRLPSEAEWEYAARAGSQTARYWGSSREDSCRYANLADHEFMRIQKARQDPDEFFMCSDGFPYTAPVGQFQPNAFGLHDVIGNVWEMTGDCWEAGLDGAPVNGEYRGGGTTPGRCNTRVVRGGSFNYAPWGARSAWRIGESGSLRSAFKGFRVARTDSNLTSMLRRHAFSPAERGRLIVAGSSPSPARGIFDPVWTLLPFARFMIADGLHLNR
jgi:formylglycine-generating enzyme required for sulfatase activity